MKRSEAYHILGRMWEDATPEQAEAISVAQNDLEFVDLMPDDMVCVVRCKDCKHYVERKEISKKCCYVHLLTPHPMPEDGFCSYGARKDGETNG